MSHDSHLKHRPRTKAEYIFLVIELVMGLFLLATVLGHVANIVTNVSAARKEFQGKTILATDLRLRCFPCHDSQMMDCSPEAEAYALD